MHGFASIFQGQPSLWWVTTKETSQHIVCPRGKVPSLLKMGVLLKTLKEHCCCHVASVGLSMSLSKSPHLRQPHLLLTTTWRGLEQKWTSSFSDAESQSTWFAESHTVSSLESECYLIKCCWSKALMSLGKKGWHKVGQVTHDALQWFV